MEIKCLYLDNFRGFSNALLPIRDVNFFVGENSTGKSSVMAIIKIIEDIQSFWFSATPLFRSGDLNLGNFKDIVSANSTDKSYFKIGIYNSKEIGDKIECDGFLITFKEKKGMPAIYRYTALQENNQIDFKFGNEKIWYKYQEANKTTKCNIDEIDNIFIKWSDMHKSRMRGYKEIPGGWAMHSLAMLSSLLMMKIKKDENYIDRVLKMNWKTIFSGRLKWLAPIRSKPRSTYDLFNLDYSPEGEHTPYVVKQYFSNVNEKVSLFRLLTHMVFNEIDHPRGHLC